jgi:cytochrome P450
MKQNEKHLKERTPPGPQGHFLLGNLRDMSDNPLTFLMRNGLSYGDLVHFHIFGRSAYLANHPDFVKHVLQENYHNYDRDTPDYNALKLVIGDGLLTSDGEFWLRQRRLMQPAFHRRRLATFGGLMAEAAQAMLQRWRPLASQSQPLDIANEMMQLTLGIASQVLFSVDISDEASDFGQAFTTVNRYLTEHYFKSPFPVPIQVPTPANREAQAALEVLNQVVTEVITAHREHPQAHDDLLTTLLEARDEETGEGMDDELIRDQVMTLLLAGHETTAVALSWTWYLLSTHPLVAQRLRAELAQTLGGRAPTIDDLANLPYTNMVIKEAMRLYPPAWVVARRAIAEDRLGEYTIPANTYVVMSPYTMHHHPGFWENPEGFDPERFSPERSKDRPSFAYFPFGGGPHLCIGRDMAMQEAPLILATVAQHYRLDLVPGHPVEMEPLITLRPRGGMLMTLHPQPVSQSA